MRTSLRSPARDARRAVADATAASPVARSRLGTEVVAATSRVRLGDGWWSAEPLSSHEVPRLVRVQPRASTDLASALGSLVGEAWR